jgi:uracil-DNA glycosylase family 4
MNKLCPICNQPIVEARGDLKSKILVISENVTEEDMQVGYALSGVYANVLRTELAQYGLDLFQMRRTSMWLHPEPKGRDKKLIEADRNWHFTQVIMEAQNRKIVLLLGSIATRFFLNGIAATNVSGIPMKADLLSAEIVMGTRSPLDILYGSHGEFCLGIKKFAEQVKKGNYYATT